MKMPLAVGLIVSLIVGFVIIALSAWRVPAVRLALLRSPGGHHVLMQALGSGLDSNAVDNSEHAKYFLALVRQHQYAEAQSLLTPGAKKSLSAPALQGQWTAFEKMHGRVTNWTGTGETWSYLPKYIDRRYLVNGSRGSAGVVTLRMTPFGGSWMVDSVLIAR